MKKIFLARSAWALFIAGSIAFGACKSNDGSTAQNSPATSASSLYPSLGTAVNDTFNAPVATTAPVPVNTVTPNDMATTGQATETTGEPYSVDSRGCEIKKHKTTTHRVAYTHTRRHKTYRRKIQHNEETTVAATTPEPINENVTTVEKPAEEPVIEKQSEYTGEIKAAPVATRKRMVHFAPEVGGNLNNLYRMAEDYQTSNMLKVGFNAGIMMNVRLGESRLSLEPGLRYIMKGGVIKSSSSDPVTQTTTEEKDKLTFHYVELPLNLIYNFGDWGTGHFMVGAGPYLSYLANAQAKTKITTNGPEGTIVSDGQHSLPLGSTDQPGNVNQWDAGAGGFIGYQSSGGTYVKAGAEVGLLDLQKNTNTLGNFYDRNYNFLLSVGYMIGYKK